MDKNYEIFNETSYDLDEEMNVIYKLLDFALKKEKIDNAIFNVILVDNNTIHDINKTYRGIDKETDVISFALEDNKMIELEIRVLGDIYISVDKAKGQALEYNHSFLRELSFLTIHGLLHLLGYDHMNLSDEKKMFAKQDEILNEFGIKRGE